MALASTHLRFLPAFSTLLPPYVNNKGAAGDKSWRISEPEGGRAERKQPEAAVGAGGAAAPSSTTSSHGTLFSSSFSSFIDLPPSSTANSLLPRCAIMRFAKRLVGSGLGSLDLFLFGGDENGKEEIHMAGAAEEELTRKKIGNSYTLRTSSSLSSSTTPFSRSSLDTHTTTTSSSSSSLPTQTSLDSSFTSFEASTSSAGSCAQKLLGNDNSNQFKCTMNLAGPRGLPAAIAHGGENVLYSSTKDQVRVVSCTDFSIVSAFANDDAPVKSLLVSGNTIFTAHHDLKIRVWQNQEIQQKLGHKRNKHKLVATLPSITDCILTYLKRDSHVQIRRHKKTLRIQHFDAIAALATGAAGTILYSGSWDRTIKVWSISGFRCLESFKAHDDAVNALAASRDGYLYSGSADGKVKVWERGLDNKHLLTASFHKHQSGVNALVLSSDEAFLYSASGDKSIKVWEREDSADHMSVVQTLKGHRHAVLCLATTRDLLASGSADKTIRIWQKSKSSSQHCCIAMLDGHRGPVKSLTISASFFHCQVYSSGLEGNLKAWWVSLGNSSSTSDGHSIINNNNQHASQGGISSSEDILSRSR